MLELKKFALAGNATFTVTSRKTGTRFTFKVRKPREDTPHFVKVLTGPDNENSYTFMGTIFTNVDSATGQTRHEYRHSMRSSIGPSAPSALAFAWLWANVDQDLSKAVEVHHEGRCCRCGRKLTVPESIESGIGPECANQM